MNRTYVTLACAILAAALAGAAAPAAVAPAPAATAGPAAPPDLEKLLTRLDDLYRAKSSISVLEITVVTPKATRSLRAKSWSKGTDKALIVIEAPAREAGTATLKVGNNLWNYLPRIARTIRVPPSMMRGAWMGSDFTNDDLVRESSYREDFTSRLVGPSAAPAGWLIEMKAKAGVVGLWERIEFVISSDGMLPVLARYYDRKDRLSRTMTFDDVKEMGGRRIPARMVLVPTDEPGRRTEMHYVEMAFDIDVPDSTFSLSSLESAR